MEKEEGEEPNAPTPSDLTAAYRSADQLIGSLQQWSGASDAMRIKLLVGMVQNLEALDPGSSGLSTSQLHELQQLSAAVDAAQTLDSLSHWDQQSDLSHLLQTGSLLQDFNTLTGGALDALPGMPMLGDLLGAVQIISSIDQGNWAGAVSGINNLTGGAVDSAVNSALGSSGVPYVSVALALNDFDKHPGQSFHIADQVLLSEQDFEWRRGTGKCIHAHLRISKHRNKNNCEHTHSNTKQQTIKVLTPAQST